MRSLAIIALIAALGAPGSAFAQFGTEPVTISISPLYPRPHETVTVTPESTQLNLMTSKVTISANGAVVEEGSGGRSASVTMGAGGTATTIRVSVVAGGVTYATETTLRPADVALVVEPTTTTHPLYDGAALPAPEGPVRLVALADIRNSSGSRVAPSLLSYTWRLGNRILTEESGIGRSVLTATAPVRYRDADVSVTVTTADESITGYAEARVSPSSPVTRAYRTDPLLGIDLAHALTGALSLGAQEESFEAVPFFFGSVPRITWTLNGAAAGSDRKLTVRPDEGSSGKARVGYGAAAGSESDSDAFNVTFDATRKGIFGF